MLYHAVHFESRFHYLVNFHRKSDFPSRASEPTESLSGSLSYTEMSSWLISSYGRKSRHGGQRTDTGRINRQSKIYESENRKLLQILMIFSSEGFAPSIAHFTRQRQQSSRKPELFERLRHLIEKKKPIAEKRPNDSVARQSDEYFAFFYRRKTIDIYCDFTARDRLS